MFGLLTSLDLVLLEVLSPDWAPCLSVLLAQLAILFYETFLLCVHLKKIMCVMCVCMCVLYKYPGKPEEVIGTLGVGVNRQL